MTDRQDHINITPYFVKFYQSNNLIIEYTNSLLEFFRFNRFVWEDPVDYRKNYPSSFFNIGGKLDFINDNKNILSINNLLKVNLYNLGENYFSEDKRVDWTTHIEDSIYKYGELNILCLHNDKELMESKRSTDWKNYHPDDKEDYQKDKSSNSKIIFRDKDNNVIHEDDYGRNLSGSPKDYDKDGNYYGYGSDKSEYLIEEIYDEFFGTFSNKQKGLFGVIFCWILYPKSFTNLLWNFYDKKTGDGWNDGGNNRRKSFDDFNFDMKVFLKKESEDLKYNYLEDYLSNPNRNPL